MNNTSIIKRGLSIFVCLLMCLNMGVSSFAQSGDSNTDFKKSKIGDFDPTIEYEDLSGLDLTIKDQELRDSLREEYLDVEIVEIENTEMGRVYHVDKDYHSTKQERNIWDIADFVMAGVSWAEFFNEPSLAEFGWAALDTVALLPVLPSTAYFRKGGKIFLKADEIKKFGRTTDGYKAIRKALIVGDKVIDVKNAAKARWLSNLRNYLYPRVNRMLNIPHAGNIDSKMVRFTQDSISKTFENGQKINDVIKGLKNKQISPQSFPPIHIFELNGKWYSLDNRRLHVFKEAGLDIKYVIVNKSTVISDAWKFTTVNDGMNIFIRR